MVQNLQVCGLLRKKVILKIRGQMKDKRHARNGIKKHYKNNQQSNRENSFIIWQRTRMTSQELFDIS